MYKSNNPNGSGCRFRLPQILICIRICLRFTRITRITGTHSHKRKWNICLNFFIISANYQSNTTHRLATRIKRSLNKNQLCSDKFICPIFSLSWLQYVLLHYFHSNLFWISLKYNTVFDWSSYSHSFPFPLYFCLLFI